MDGKKQFVILGNMNAITYKEVFPRLKDNEIWLGYKSLNQDMYFTVTDEYKKYLVENKKEGSAYKIVDGIVMGRLASACWFTNLDHGKRHEILSLDTMAHNLKFNKQLRKRFHDKFGIDKYPKYDNYDAIEVPFTECIPSDYDGIIGVPITFLDKYNPNQFEIVGRDGDLDLSVTYDFFTPPDKEVAKKYKKANKTWRVQNAYFIIDGMAKTSYKRLFIRLK